MSSKHEKFVYTVDENLFCPICHEVLQDPVSCKDGHAFCNKCIREWLDTNNTCPLDNTLIKKENLVRLLMVRGIIDNLEVYCQPQDTETKADDVDNSRKTCGWTGMLKNVKAHREICPYQEVKCPNENCVEIIQRREIEDHDKVCDFKVVVCEECGLKLVRRDLEKHIENDCPEELISCPNKCTRRSGVPSTLKRKDLEEHLTNVCPKAIVCCPLEEHGCLAKVERQHVDKHVQDNMHMAAHIMLLAKENKQLKEELTRVKEEFHYQLLSACSYTWTIPDYPDLSRDHPNGSCIESPTFWLRGYKWRISLSPNGDDADATGFLSLFLNKVEDDSQALSDTMPSVSSNESAIPFRLTVISQKLGTDDVYHETEYVFTKKESNLGWPQFMKASDALSPSYCNNGRLTIQCTIQLDKPQ